MPTRLSKIDELTRSDHTFLVAEDECYYIGEYTARAGYAFSGTNDLIQNLKKPMNRRGRPEWRYKEWAIRRSGEMLREVLTQERLEHTTIVPMPPSIVRGDPNHDDRLLQILQELSRGRQLDIRELVIMKRSVEPSHLGERATIEDLIDSMVIDEATVEPRPTEIALIDDVLTTGRHFKAVQTILRGRFPEMPIVGIFIARRTPGSTAI